MLTKYKKVKPKKGVNKPFEKCFHVWRIFQNFFREGTLKLDIFFGAVFGKFVLKHIENEKGSRGVRGHAPPENV